MEIGAALLMGRKVSIHKRPVLLDHVIVTADLVKHNV